MGTIACRVDCSSLIGSGHLFRCKAIAEQLSRRGHRVVFVTRNLPKTAAKQLEGINAQVYSLPPLTAAIPFIEDKYDTWLGIDEFADANGTLSCLAALKTDLIIADHYGLTRVWHDEIKAHIPKLVVYDDLVDRSINANLVINPNFGWIDKHYEGLVGPETKLVLGPKYATLNTHFHKLRKESIAARENRELTHLLISFGGADPRNFTAKVLDVIQKISFERPLKLTVVAGLLNKNIDDLRSMISRMDLDVTLVDHLDRIWETYLKTDLVIGAVGTSVWERCCLGVPSISIPIAENQRSAARALVCAGAIKVIDPENHNWRKALSTEIENLQNKNRLRELGNRASRVCDGLGGFRVVSLIEGILNDC